MNKNKNKPCAIILAAGLSKRMGKEDKLLKNLNGKPLVSHIFHTLYKLSDQFSSIIVIGNNSTMKSLVESFQFTYIHNENPNLGMGVSVSIAVKSSQTINCSGYMVFLGDMPHIQEETIQLICEAHLQNSNKIIQPIFHGKPGNPVLFPTSFYDELASLSEDFGGRQIIKNSLSEITLLPVLDAGILKDYDKKEDF